MASLLLDTYPSNSKGPRLTNRSPSLGRPQVSTSNLQRSTTPSFSARGVGTQPRTRLRSPQASLLDSNAAQLNPNAYQQRPKENPLLELAADLTAQAALFIAERETQLEAKDALSTLQSKLSNHAYGFNTQQLQADGSQKTIHNPGYLELKSKDAWQNREQAIDGIQQIINENVPSSPAAKKVYLAQATAYGTGYTSMYNRHAAAALKEWENNQLTMDLNTFSNELTSRTIAAALEQKPFADVQAFATDQLTQLGQTYALPPIKLKELSDKVVSQTLNNINSIVDPLNPDSYQNAINATNYFREAFTKGKPLLASGDVAAQQQIINLTTSYNKSIVAKENRIEQQITKQRQQNDTRFYMLLYGSNKADPATLVDEATQLFSKNLLSPSLYRAVNNTTTNQPKMDLNTLNQAMFNVQIGRTVDGTQAPPEDVAASIDALTEHYRREDVSRIYNSFRTTNTQSIRTKQYEITRSVNSMLSSGMVSNLMVMNAPQLEEKAHKILLESITIDKATGAPAFSKTPQQALNEAITLVPGFERYKGYATPSAANKALRKGEPAPSPESEKATPQSAVAAAQKNMGMPISAQTQTQTQTQTPEAKPATMPAPLPTHLFGKAYIHTPKSHPLQRRNEISKLATRAAFLFNEGSLTQEEYDRIRAYLKEEWKRR